jgi:hypothetical protein
MTSDVPLESERLKRVWELASDSETSPNSITILCSRQSKTKINETEKPEEGGSKLHDVCCLRLDERLGDDVWKVSKARWLIKKMWMEEGCVEVRRRRKMMRKKGRVGGEKGRALYER